MSERHVLGGVPYVPVGTSTVEHDVWIMGRMKLGGVDEVEVKEGEDLNDWAKRLLFSLSASGQAVALLAGLLVPESVGADNWTVAVAASTMQHLSSLKSDEDKELVFALLVQELVGFFRSGAVSAWSLRTSSVDGAVGGKGESPKQ